MLDLRIFRWVRFALASRTEPVVPLYPISEGLCVLWFRSSATRALQSYISRARFARPGVQIPACGRHRAVPQRGLHEVNRRAAIQRM